MQNYISAQSDLLEQLKKTHINFKKTPKERLTVSYVTTKLELLNKTWDNVQDNHMHLLRNYDKKLLSATDYVKDDVFYYCEEEFIANKVTMMEKLSHLEPQIHSNAPSESFGTIIPSKVTSTEVKIPALKIPTFTGQYTEWISFYDQFMSLIHNNMALSNVQKLHYLKMHIDGDAATLLKNIPVTDKNYEAAWAKLQKRFSNKRVIVNAYLKKLMSIKPITIESANSIRNLLDTTTDCLSGLNSIGVDTDNWDAIIIYLTTSKLDSESLKQWEERINQDGEDNLPKMITFTEFLETRFRSLEGIQAARPNPVRTKQTHEKKVYHANTDPNEKLCTYCSGEHYIYKCNDFIQLSYQEKKEFIEKKKLCFNCLIPYHGVKVCKQKHRCRKCGKKHNTLIHPEENDDIRTYTTNRDKTSDTEEETSTTSEKINTHFEKINTHFEKINTHFEKINTHFGTKSLVKTEVLLATALVRVNSENGRILKLRALIDQGSEGSFITESAAQALGLKREKIHGQISGIGGTQSLTSKHKVSFTLTSNQRNTDFSLNVNAYVLTTLTRLLPSRHVQVTWKHLENLPLADPSYGTPGKIDLLLGAAVYSRIIQDGVINGPPGTPLAQRTHLGWILSGEINTSEHCKKERIINMHVTTTQEESNLLQKFWEIETDETNKRKRFTEEEIECETTYENTYTRDENGRYIVQIPLRDREYDYGDTREIAKKRLQQLERKLETDTKLKEEYTKVIIEYKELGHMEEIKEDKVTCTKDKFYLPHHAVVRPQKSTSQVRVVFNASSKGPNGMSLNDNMLVGPTIQRDLRHIVMSWRLFKIAFVADCVKMYRQIRVTNKCADLQRILWRVNGELKEYKLCRVTFGTASAPYLATKTLQKLAEDEKDKYKVASEITKRDFYMDDLLSGGDNLEEVCKIYNEMTALMNEGGFKLQKWASNDRNFVEYIEKEGKEPDETYVIKNDEVVKTLGIRWDKTTDNFQYTTNLMNLPSDKITKRSILADIARLFDPMGWLAPVIILAKVIIQKLWLTGVTWDQNIPDKIKEEWLQYKSQLPQVQNITIQRWLHTNNEDILRELHGFSDASNTAYAAVVYLRVVKQDGKVSVQLVTAKTRVAPIKTVSIPRLELCGAVLLTRLLNEVSEQLNINSQHVHAYTDSNVVLAWLQSHPSRWKTFIANRTSEILTSFSNEHWHHVASESNPADVASRGVLPAQLLKHHLWWTGPKELTEKNFEPKTQKNFRTDLEEKPVKAMTTTIQQEEDNIFLRYSNLTKLLRVLSYMRRAITKYKPKLKHLTGEEINEAMSKCILLCQKQSFTEEIERLKDDKSIKMNSKLRTLNPFLDRNGVLRVGGRLANADIGDGTKHQIILPGNHPFTKLVLADCHIKTLHGGPMLMLSHLRTKFWLINSKNTAKSTVHKCVICARYKASTATQMMGSLPKVRTTPAKPFLNSGVDLAGPIDLRLSKGRGCKTQKGYLVIFICMVVRAVHIEIVTSLTAQDFVAAFKRFVARRGHCKNMWSDNATNLVAGNKELITLFQRSIHQVRKEIEELLANDGTTWHHIPPSAPHFGGLWEAGVKSIKFHLKRILRNSTLTYEEMSTITAQIEACLNSRPISPISDDPSDFTPLTPGHFLIGEAPITVPDDNYLEMNMNRLDRWQLTQRKLQDFWARWSTEYLTRLQQRPKWLGKRPNLKIGELVLLKEDNMPPGKWSMARIVETHPGNDNLIRVVTVKCRNSIFKRPITKDEPASSGDSGDESGSEPESPTEKLIQAQSHRQDWIADVSELETGREHKSEPQASTSSTTQEADSSKPSTQSSLPKILPKLPGGAMLYHPGMLGLDGLGSNLGLGNLAMGYPHSFILGLANQGQEGASSSTQPQFITIPLSMAMAAAAGNPSTSTNGCPVSASSDDSSELQDLSTGGRK